MNSVFGEFALQVNEKKLRTEAEKKTFFANTDWRRMTTQDQEFWEKVVSFLNA